MDIMVDLADGEQRVYNDTSDFIVYDDSISFTWNGWEVSFQLMNLVMYATKESEEKVTGLKLV